MIIEKILKFLKIHFASSLTLKDGTPLSVDGNFETGAKVSVVTTDGEIPLPDGEYQCEDSTIIIVKDGIIMDIVSPGEVDPNMVPPEQLSDEVIDKLAGQKGNPEVSGIDPIVEEDPNLITPSGDTATIEEVVEPPVDNPVEKPVDETSKIADLETKIADLTSKLDEVMKKLNLISEKFSVAAPIIKKIETDRTIMDPRLQQKVDLIRMLKKTAI